MAEPERMPQVVCWTLLLICSMQILFDARHSDSTGLRNGTERLERWWISDAFRS